MKLISMTDFVLKIAKERIDYEVLMESSSWDYGPSDFNKVLDYAKLLKTPLNIGMFAPCDEEGNVIKERPEPKILAKGDFSYTSQNFWDEKYDKAKDKVLFEGFEVIKQNDYYVLSKGDNIIWLSWNKSKNVEYLLKMTNEAELSRLAWEEINKIITIK